MDRRQFLSRIGFTAAAAAVLSSVLDPDALLWQPGKKVIILPPTHGWQTGYSQGDEYWYRTDNDRTLRAYSASNGTLKTGAWVKKCPERVLWTKYNEPLQLDLSNLEAITTVSWLTRDEWTKSPLNI